MQQPSRRGRSGAGPDRGCVDDDDLMALIARDLAGKSSQTSSSPTASASGAPEAEGAPAEAKPKAPPKKKQTKASKASELDGYLSSLGLQGKKKKKASSGGGGASTGLRLVKNSAITGLK